ncbi:MAG: FCD domain-containing protein [Burkholderiales bacterium]
MPARKRCVNVFSPVVGNRPADEIIAQIRVKLSAQELKAGDRLPSERELSEQFAVSRNSVRQALRTLAELGLLDIRKGASGGAFIHEGGGGAVTIGLQDLYTLGTIRPEDLTEVRLLLSVEVARLACERCSDEDIDALEANVVAAERAARQPDLSERTQINLEFHRMLGRMTRNPLLMALTDAVMDIMSRFVNEVGRTPNRTVMPLRRKLLAHLRKRDAAAAAQEMRAHLLRLHQLYLKASAAGVVEAVPSPVRPRRTPSTTETTNRH